MHTPRTIQDFIERTLSENEITVHHTGIEVKDKKERLEQLKRDKRDAMKEYDEHIDLVEEEIRLAQAEIREAIDQNRELSAYKNYLERLSETPF